MEKTKKNLELALAGESVAHIKYKYFAEICRKKGREDIAELFERTSKDEVAHALGHIRFLYPEHLYTPEQLLKIAIDGETYEYMEMYPEFVREATEENHAHAVNEFNEQISESKEHASWFASMLPKIEKMFKGLVNVEKHHADKYKTLVKND